MSVTRCYGNGYTYLVIKAGSAQSNEDGEARKEFVYPSAGTAFVGRQPGSDAPRQLSHIIVCQGPLVTPVPRP